MATTEEEFEALKMTAGRPIPGQSLTNDPENPAPFEKAPAFTSVHAASGYLWESFIEPRKYMKPNGICCRRRTADDNNAGYSVY